MTQTIEQLTARVRELEEENARLSEVVESNIDDGINKIMAMSDEQVSALAGFEGSNPEDKATIARQCMDIAMIRVDLAASQAYAEQLREAIKQYLAENDPSEFGCACDPLVGYLCGPCFAYKQQAVLRQALAQPSDTSALDSFVAEKVKEAGKFDMWKTNPYTKVLETSIEQLTKQRDLAVEALEKIAAPVRADGTYNRCREACEILARETLSAIKKARGCDEQK